MLENIAIQTWVKLKSLQKAQRFLSFKEVSRWHFFDLLLNTVKWFRIEWVLYRNLFVGTRYDHLLEGVLNLPHGCIVYFPFILSPQHGALLDLWFYDMRKHRRHTSEQSFLLKLSSLEVKALIHNLCSLISQCALERWKLAHGAMDDKSTTYWSTSDSMRRISHLMTVKHWNCFPDTSRVHNRNRRITHDSVKYLCVILSQIFVIGLAESWPK